MIVMAVTDTSNLFLLILCVILCSVHHHDFWQAFNGHRPSRVNALVWPTEKDCTPCSNNIVWLTLGSCTSSCSDLNFFSASFSSSCVKEAFSRLTIPTMNNAADLN